MSAGNIDFVDFTPPQTVPFSDVAIRLSGSDNVAIAKANLQANTKLVVDETLTVTLQNFIPGGHKRALVLGPVDEPVRRYGQIIGFATQVIEPGQHVHSHNLALKEFERDYAFGVDVQPVAFVPPDERRTFLGYSGPTAR